MPSLASFTSGWANCRHRLSRSGIRGQLRDARAKGGTRTSAVDARIWVCSIRDYRGACHRMGGIFSPIPTLEASAGGDQSSSKTPGDIGAPPLSKSVFLLARASSTIKNCRDYLISATKIAESSKGGDFPRLLKKAESGVVYVWTSELAKRPDMHPYGEDSKDNPYGLIIRSLPLIWKHHEKSLALRSGRDEYLGVFKADKDGIWFYTADDDVKCSNRIDYSGVFELTIRVEGDDDIVSDPIKLHVDYSRGAFLWDIKVDQYLQ